MATAIVKYQRLILYREHIWHYGTRQVGSPSTILQVTHGPMQSRAQFAVPTWGMVMVAEQIIKVHVNTSVCVCVSPVSVSMCVCVCVRK